MFARLLTIFLPVAFGVVALNTSHTSALGGNNGIVIAQVQAGAATVAPNGDAAATQEFISVFNNTNAPIDLTNWCLTNKSASFACFTPPTPQTTMSLASHAYGLIASDSFAARYAVTADVVFPTTNKTSGSLTGGSDTLSLLNANGVTVDSIAWTLALAGGSALVRNSAADGMLIDTDASTDFKKVLSLTVPSSGVTDTVHIVDECTNIDSIQTTIPDGYGQLSDGSCVHDVCPNLDGLQAVMPDGMRTDDNGRCVLIMPVLYITELLPNASGSDSGNEFIELFNPNAVAVELTNFRLQVGLNFEKTYAFAAGSTIGAGQYQSFSNVGIPFSLLNTSSRVRLVSADGQTISDTPPYTNPADNQAWAFIDDTWMFTNQPTPGLPNLLPLDSADAPVVTVVTGLKACAVNQYRSPDTNRCRVVASSPSLAACKDGQYRSEETNRCRSIATDAAAVKTCSDDQVRNPDTGRCKKIATVDEIKDCGEGRERNPATNRCRNVVATASSNLTGGVRLASASAASVLGWWAAGIVAFVACGYAALEWRGEIGQWVRERWSRLRYNKTHEDNRY